MKSSELPSGYYTPNELNPNLRLSRLFAYYSKNKEDAEIQRTTDENVIETSENLNIVTSSKDIEEEEYPPFNFSWLDSKRIAGMGWPQTVSNLNYIASQGINHLITLSPERVPPILDCKKKLRWTEIPVKEFQPPTLHQILKFIDICERSVLRGETVGVHCRQGRGRTGVMLACYLVKFKDMAPERAVMTVRVIRPGSCETFEQEKAVCHYHDCLRGTIQAPDWRLVDDKKYFDANFNKEDTNEHAQEETGSKEPAPKTPRPKSKAMIINHKIYF